MKKLCKECHSALNYEAGFDFPNKEFESTTGLLIKNILAELEAGLLQRPELTFSYNYGAGPLDDNILNEISKTLLNIIKILKVRFNLPNQI